MSITTLIQQMQQCKADNESLSIDQVLKIFQIHEMREATRRRYGG